MTSPAFARALRLGGAVLLLGLMGLAARASVVAPGDRVEAGGVIAAYRNDTVILSREEGPRYNVVVSPRTIVRDETGPSSLSALRPGRHAVVFGETWRIGRTLTARTILVWGGPDRVPGRVTTPPP